MQLTQTIILNWLEDVKDPEIPVLSLVDLGVIRQIDVNENNVSILLTPTFVGCPALDMMKDDIVTSLKGHGINDVKIAVTFREPWTSDMISEKGKAALKKFGLAPPPTNQLIDDIDVLEHASCPRCGGNNTELKHTFGPTLCRSIHYCLDCRDSFEQFKPI